MVGVKVGVNVDVCVNVGVRVNVGADVSVGGGVAVSVGGMGVGIGAISCDMELEARRSRRRRKKSFLNMNLLYRVNFSLYTYNIPQDLPPQFPSSQKNQRTLASHPALYISPRITISTALTAKISARDTTATTHKDAKKFYKYFGKTQIIFG